MSVGNTARWVALLETVDPVPLAPWLSPQGAQAAWDEALAPLTLSALAALSTRPGPPWEHAAFVAAGTVFTAPIEWLAALLARGTKVVLKHPAGNPGAAEVLARTAQLCDLPLTATGDRGAVRAPLVVAMGSDATMRSLRRELPATTRLLAHGHRFSAVWHTGAELAPDPRVPAGFASAWQRIAADAALHDGRGCLSPTVVFTQRPLAEACDALAQAMQQAQERWPVGDVSPAESVAIRTRAALARVVGEVRSGPGWSVHGLPSDRVRPAAMARSLVVTRLPNAAALRSWLGPWRSTLSTLGTDRPDHLAGWAEIRTCAPGRMQRPDLFRLHDGVDWVASLDRPL